MSSNIWRTHRPKRKPAPPCDCVAVGPGVPGCTDSACGNRLTLVECGDACALGAECRNQRLRRKEGCELERFETEMKGIGVRCPRPLRAGALVAEYVGEVVDTVESERRVEAQRAAGHVHFYMMQIGKDLVSASG